MKSLWLPYVVADLATARAFYTDHLGLSEVDSWRNRHERGSVLRATDGAVIELVEALPDAPAGAAPEASTGVGAEHGPSPPPLAFEVDDERAVDAYAARLGATPHRYPRGHYGFEVPGPAGATIMIWSER